MTPESPSLPVASVVIPTRDRLEQLVASPIANLDRHPHAR